MTVYAKIENGQLITAYNGYNGIIGFAGNVELMLANGFAGYDEEIISKYFAGQAEIQGNQLVDISNTDEYKAKIAAQEKNAKTTNLLNQIDQLDQKRIRAGFEPSVKDSTTGQTYLEFYTSQIQDLRKQLAALG